MVFGHTRAVVLGDLLESLRRQSAIQFVDLWLDGYQGKTETLDKVTVTRRLADGYTVGVRHYHNGQLGFRKLMLQAMQHAVANYRHIMFLEDDCFPTHDAVAGFRTELDAIASRPEVFSVYGHPFLMAEETGYCTRFQGWGWATTAEKLAPYLNALIECYSIPEGEFLEFTRSRLTPDVIARLDVTPPRLPTDTLRKFFAWDETLALLTALDGKVHKTSRKRLIYNCGMGRGSSHFGAHSVYREPPFNLIEPDEVWDVF